MKLGKAIKHEITIKASNNMGFIVNVGCGTFVYQDVEKMLKDMKDFFKDPEKAEKAYEKENNRLKINTLHRTLSRPIISYDGV